MPSASSESETSDGSSSEEHPLLQSIPPRKVPAAVASMPRSSRQQPARPAPSEHPRNPDRSMPKASQQARPEKSPHASRPKDKRRSQRRDEAHDHPRERKRSRGEREPSTRRDKHKHHEKQTRRRDEEERHRRDKTDATERGEQKTRRRDQEERTVAQERRRQEKTDATERGEHSCDRERSAPSIDKKELRNVVRLFSYGWLGGTLREALYEITECEWYVTPSTLTFFRAFMQEVFMTRGDLQRWREGIIKSLNDLRKTRLSFGDEFTVIDDERAENCLRQWAQTYDFIPPHATVPWTKKPFANPYIVSVTQAFGCPVRMREIVKRGLVDFNNVNGCDALAVAFFEYVETIETKAADVLKERAQTMKILAARDARQLAKPEAVHDGGKGKSGKSEKPGKSGRTHSGNKRDQDRSRHSGAGKDCNTGRPRQYRPWHDNGCSLRRRDSEDDVASRIV